MFNILKKLMQSKKSSMAVLGVAVEMALAFFFVADDPELKLKVMELVAYIFSAYILGQGVADMGKEKSKVEKGLTDAKPPA